MNKPLKPKELANYWGIDVEAVLGLIHQGKLRAFNVSCGAGRPRWLIDPAAVEEYKQNHSPAPPEPKTVRRRRQKVAAETFYAE